MYSHKHAVENTEFPEGTRTDGGKISPSSIRDVLVALASHANAGDKDPQLKNWAWPSNETLAKESKSSVATVKRVLAWAKHLGFFRRVESRQAEGRTTRYQFRDVIEVDGKEMFLGGGSQDMDGDGSEEQPWAAPRELWGSSLGNKGAAPQALLPVSAGATDGSAGATKTIKNSTNQGFQLKTITEHFKAALTGSNQNNSTSDTCTICGGLLDEDGDCQSWYVEHFGPVAEDVLSDFTPRYEDRSEEGLTLFYVWTPKGPRLALPVPRPRTIVTLYADNIRGRNPVNPETVGPEYLISDWESYFRSNHKSIALPDGTKEFNLSPEELESVRSSSIARAGLPSEFDLGVAFDFISMVIPKDDPEFERFRRRVLSVHHDLTERVPALASANKARSASQLGGDHGDEVYEQEGIEKRPARAKRRRAPSGKREKGRGRTGNLNRDTGEPPLSQEITILDEEG